MSDGGVLNPRDFGGESAEMVYTLSSLPIFLILRFFSDLLMGILR